MLMERGLSDKETIHFHRVLACKLNWRKDCSRYFAKMSAKEEDETLENEQSNEPSTLHVSHIPTQDNQKFAQVIIIIYPSNFSQSFQSKQTFYAIPKQELDQMTEEKAKLVQENFSLRSKIIELQGVADERHTRILLQESELNLLKEENQKLREELDKLHMKFDALRTKVDAQVDYENLLIAIQDINQRHQLEHDCPELYDMRQKRTGFPHFINDRLDRTDLQNYKVAFTLRQINSMSPACRKKFNKNFGDDFISSVSSTIATVIVPGVTVTPAEETTVANWWVE
jgi:hypothetical protein